MLVVENIDEMLALNKALFEARYHANPDHEEVQGSPLVAAVHNRLVDALIAVEKDPAKQVKWTEWRQWRNRPVETRQVEQIVKQADWTTLNAEQKRVLVRCLVVPFVADDEEIEALIKRGNRIHAAEP